MKKLMFIGLGLLVVSARSMQGAQAIALHPRYIQKQFIQAVCDGNIPAAQSYITKGAEVNRLYENYTPLQLAMYVPLCGSMDGKVETDLSPNGKSARGHNSECKSKMVEFLLSKGANPNAQGRHYTNIERALQQDIPFELLERYGVDINQKNESGNTIVHRATWDRHLDIEFLMSKKGANVNAQNNDGQTPLHVAARQFNIDTVNPLLGRGARVNIPDKKGNTPLHIAIIAIVQKRYIPTDAVVKALLAADADRTIKNNEGKTAFDIVNDLAKADNIRAISQQEFDELRKLLQPKVTQAVA